MLPLLQVFIFKLPKFQSKEFMKAVEIVFFLLIGLIAGFVFGEDFNIVENIFQMS